MFNIKKMSMLNMQDNFFALKSTASSPSPLASKLNADYLPTYYIRKHIEKHAPGDTIISFDTDYHFNDVDTLTLSMLIKPSDIHLINPLKLVTTLALKQSLSKLYGNLFSFKWDNQLLVNDKKIAVVRCEDFSYNHELYVIVSIALNLTQPIAYFKENNLLNETSLKLHIDKKLLSPTPFPNDIAPEEICEQFISAFNSLYSNLETTGFSTFKSEYSMNCVDVGKMTKVVVDGVEQSAFCVGVSKDGELMVNLSGKVCYIENSCDIIN